MNENFKKLADTLIAVQDSKDIMNLLVMIASVVSQSPEHSEDKVPLTIGDTMNKGEFESD